MQEFHPAVRRWFERTYGTPTPPQTLGWPSISSGKNTLILAPTGSGKTLAAFLWAINHLVEQHLREDLPAGVRILYISPLKALNNDIERNLVAPLRGIREEAQAEHLKLPPLRTAVRTGDTPASQRASMIRHPPDILITTPESLYLLLTSREARRMLRTVQYVIVDEIHSICGNKRGVHLSLSLERLQEVADQDFVRIGLSATQRPLDRVAAFLGGQGWHEGLLRPRKVTIIDAGRKKTMDLKVECPAPDFSNLPQDGVWALLFRTVLALIRRHRTTLIFVNNRRLAERIATRLNDMVYEEETGESAPAVNLSAVPVRTAPRTSGKDRRPESGPELVRAYHGSMSRQAREAMEGELKAGELRALVATSSLELGIDIGSIDLVLQIQSPKGVARGLQRVGRSGHLVTATSVGRIFPTHREDLVEAAVVARAMMEHEVEETSIPNDCLDVLAQQIVAMVSVDEWEVDRLYDVVRRSYCYRTLSRALFTGVLQMLGGRFTEGAFRELRARISWDTVNGVLRALPGSKQLAVTGGGTIADRGAYGVYLEDGKTKVGEVDEEFVYESRAGDTFILGTNVWRMQVIDGNRITVIPAPGEPARMPFWRGEGIGRSFELGKRVSAFRRAMSDRLDTDDCLIWLRREFPIDQDAAWNLQDYFRRQRDVAGVIPHDRQIVVESFRDEIGDPRIVVHSAFGRRVNGLLGMFLLHRVQSATGAEPQMLYNDDGILLRTSDSAPLPTGLLGGITLRAVEDVVLDELLASPLFAGQFRQNASRALLLPKLAPSKRTPLWLQRLRAGDLLQTVRQFDNFPIVIETVREVLNEVLDFGHFRELVSAIEQGNIAVTDVTTEVPSPFAASLLFDFIAVYMYEGDQSRSERLGRYLAVNREILSDIVDLEALPSLIRPEALELVEGQLQHTTEGTRARSPEELMEILLRIGDLSDGELALRCAREPSTLLEPLRRDRRAIAVDFPGGPRWIAGEDDSLYAGLPAEQNLVRIFRRFLEYHGPTSAADLAERYGIPPDRARAVLELLSADPAYVRGRFRPAPAEYRETEWCYRPNLERVHRQTIALLRHEIRPCTLADFTEFIVRWQHLHPETRLQGHTAPDDVVVQMCALPLPVEIWEREIFMRRIRDYAPTMVAGLGSAGTIVWQGSGSGRMRPLMRGEAGAFDVQSLPPDERQLGEAADRILHHLSRHGASFLTDLRAATRLSLDALNAGLAELFWMGFITNDLFAELLHVRRSTRPGGDAPLERIELVSPRHNPHRGQFLQAARRALRQVPGWSGRWSLLRTTDVLGPELPLAGQAARHAVQLLERYGIVAREFHRREDLLPWPLIAAEFQRMELRGEIRRGYFVEGLSGMQFALPSAMDALQSARSTRGVHHEPLLVNACDPANPFGPGIALPPGAGGDTETPNRLPGTTLVFHRGSPVLVLENSGARIRTFPGSDPAAIASGLRQFTGMIRLPDPLRPFRDIRVELIDGLRPVESPLLPVLRDLGFERDANQTLRLDAYAAR